MYYDQKESGKRIQKLRRLHGYTQSELSEKIGVQENTLGRIESGIRGVSIDLAIELCVCLETSLDYIYLGRESQTRFLKREVEQLIIQLNKINEKL